MDLSTYWQCQCRQHFFSFAAVEFIVCYKRKKQIFMRIYAKLNQAGILCALLFPLFNFQVGYHFV